MRYLLHCIFVCKCKLRQAPAEMSVCLQLMISQGDLKTIIANTEWELTGAGTITTVHATTAFTFARLTFKDSGHPHWSVWHFGYVSVGVFWVFSSTAGLQHSGAYSMIVWVTDVCLSVWMPPNFFFKLPLQTAFPPFLCLHPTLGSHVEWSRVFPSLTLSSSSYYYYSMSQENLTAAIIWCNFTNSQHLLIIFGRKKRYLILNWRVKKFLKLA